MKAHERSDYLLSGLFLLAAGIICLCMSMCSCTIEYDKALQPQDNCVHNINWRTHPVERLEIQIKSNLPQVTVLSGRSMNALTTYTIKKQFYNCWSLNATDSTGVIVIVEAEGECLKVF